MKILLHGKKKGTKTKQNPFNLKPDLFEVNFN